MEYMGKNSMSTDPDGKIVVSGESSDAQRLPKYTEDGRLYTYILRETSVTWPNGSAPDSTLVFGTPTINNYIVTNFYDSIQGALKVKKLMELPVGADGKPEDIRLSVLSFQGPIRYTMRTEIQRGNLYRKS